MLIAFAFALASFGTVPTGRELPMPPPPKGMTLKKRAALEMPPPPKGMKRKDLPMPPPPAGMRPLAPAEVKELAQAASDAPDDPEVARQVEEQSAELEQMRAMEEVALDPAARPNADLLGAMRRIGFGNPLRHRASCSFDEGDLRDDLPAPELERITDLASFDVSLVKDEYDIPVEMKPLVAQYIQFFQGPGRRWFRNWMSRSTRYIPMMQPILEAKGLPRDTVYLAMIESGFSPQALSWARAAGPWQFIPTTAKMYGLKQDFWVDERRDPLKATHAAAAFLDRLHTDLGDWYLAWAGYNAGGNRLRRMVEIRKTTNWWEISEGRGLMKETKHYVPKLIACALVAKHPKAFGFDESEFDWQEPLEFDEVQLTTTADLDVVARAAGTTVGGIQELNPELKRWCTPPASEKEPYTLRVPKGAGESFLAAFARVPISERLAFRVHHVKKGDTLSGIATAYGSASEAIMRMNGLRSPKALKLGSDLVVPVPTAAATRKGLGSAVIERQAAQARRTGFAAPRPEDEVPAGTAAVKQVSAHLGVLKTEAAGGKTKVTYGVQSGDSLWAISQRFKCSVDDLKKWNSLASKNLAVGATLVIYQ